MSADLEPRTPDIPAVMDPQTGEALVLADAPTDSLAGFLDHVREIETNLREQKKAVTAEIIDRMDREAKWTGEVGDYVIKGDGPTRPTEYDAEALHAALLEYVDAGAITDAALEAAIERTFTYKAKHRGLQALTKLGGDIAAVIHEHSREAEKDRRVSVKRKLLA